MRLANFLLVEDDDDHAHLVMRSLRRARVVNDVDRVVNGEEAMKYLNREAPYEDKQTPGVVLLDLHLPKLDGHEVLQRIRDDEKLSWLPVVILTTSSDEVDRAKAYGNNANSYLVKPVDFSQFQKMVDDLSLYWGVWNQLPPGADVGSSLGGESPK